MRFYHNVEGLNDHFKHIVSDQFYLTADVILLNETWTDPNSQFDIPGFQMFCSLDREDANQKIDARCYVTGKLLPATTPGSNYSCCSKLFRHGRHSISIAIVIMQQNLYCSLYCSPQSPIPVLLEDLEFVVSYDYMYIVLAGDFNVEFGTVNSRRRAVLDFMDQYHLKSSLPETITSTTRASTFIDNIFTNFRVTDSGTYVSFTSHHEPLCVLLN